MTSSTGRGTSIGSRIGDRGEGQPSSDRVSLFGGGN